MATSVPINPRLLTEINDQPNSRISPISGYEQEDLVSLERACEPLQSMFNGELTTYIRAAKSNSATPRDRLTPDESAAIRLYTTEWDVRTQSLYKKLNQALRVGESVQLRPWFKYLKLLLTAFFKLPPVGYKMVWRGVVEVPIDDYDEGEEKVWWGFTSCTAVCGTLADAAYFDRSHVRIMFSIETSSGKSVRSHSDFMVEDEILLPPGIRLKVVSKVMLDESLYMVHLEDIQPPYGYLIPPSPPQRDRPVPPVRPMPIRLSQVSPSNVEIPILLNMPKDVKNCSISDERFERCIGDVSIEGDGRVAVHSKRLCSGDVRGKQDYSSGQHRLKIRLQKNRSRLSIIIGVISKSTPMKIDSYKNPTFYGWASLTQCYLGGVFRKSGDAYSMHDNCENDTIELIIDVEGRMLQYTNQRTEQSAQLAVDVSRCPLPWKLHLSLGGDDDEVRLVNE